MLRDKIQNQVKEAMRARDQVRLDALRYLWSEIKNEEIDAKNELNDEGVQKIVAREAKKRKEALRPIRQTQGKQAQGKLDEKMRGWMQEEEAKLRVIEEFMPKMMSEKEIELEIEKVMEGGAREFGQVMGQVMRRVKGRVDGEKVREVVEAKLKN